MSLKLSRIALIGKYFDAASGTSAAMESVRDSVCSIADFLSSLGCKVFLPEKTAELTNLRKYPICNISDIGILCDAAIVVGGDGTMLGIARELAKTQTPLIGINHGRLGFITDIKLSDYKSALEPILKGQYQGDKRELLYGCVMRKTTQGEEKVFESVAMNDIVVNRGVTASMVELRVEVNGHFVANHLADGIIIATPTGSTAYSLSAGGPLIHPFSSAWALVPIAPHSLSNRPVIVPNPVEIAIEIVSGVQASTSFDMLLFPDLRQGDRIIARRSHQYAHFLHPLEWNYFDTLRKKLHWNEASA